MSAKVVTSLILFVVSAALAEDFKTTAGREYKDAVVTRVEPDGIVVKIKSGVTKIYFAELPQEVQQRFHYNEDTAATYAAEQSANYAAYQRQQEATRRQRDDAEARNKAIAAQQQATDDRIRTLEARYAGLQEEESTLLLQIGEAKQPGPEYREGKSVRHHPNPKASQLPLLQGHLSDVRKEKDHVRKQLEKEQR